MRTCSQILISAIFMAAFLTAPAARSDNMIELGTLECFVDEGTGFVIGSSKDISCVFTSNQVEWGEDNYFGAINRLGIDIGTTEESHITWLVVTASLNKYEPGFLTGDYIGASTSASFAVGLGANVLIGGSNKAIALQPLSIQTQTGINFAAGVAEMELRSILVE